MQNKTEGKYSYIQKILKYIVCPLILILFPLLKLNRGIDLTDTAYSLGNYRFFGDSRVLWILLTYLSNVAGHLFTLLPFGGTMIGMKLYCSLIVGALGILGYRFFQTKMPFWLAFLGELAAIGLCWCPVVILYNYLTYFFFLLGVILLFRGLAGARPFCLFFAGVCLGINTFVRFPNNGLEVALILALWYYGAVKKKDFAQIARETGLCILGYAIAFAGALLAVSSFYGSDAFQTMLQGLTGMSGSASDYTFAGMLLAIVDAYLHGFKWLLYMLLCILPGIPFMIISKDRFVLARKVIYCICILFLFLVLGKWGMFNFRYYQKEAALQWGAVFLLLSMGICIWMLFTGALDHEWKLIGALALIVILITPLGSNNYIWPVLNNLFFIAPVTFWMVYRFARWGRAYLDETQKVPLFSAKAMSMAIVAAFLIQSVMVGCHYVFLDGEGGEKLDTVIDGNEVLDGMRTTGTNAEVLEELTTFMLEQKSEFTGKKLLLYGNIPGLCYYLDRPSAIFTSWADLDTNTKELLEADLEKLKQNDAERPLVIVTPQLAAYFSEDAEAMNWFGVDQEAFDKDVKLQLIRQYVKDENFTEAFVNEAFVVYQ